MTQRTFASDNAAPAHPAMLRAIEAANDGHAVSYGEDAWTARATEKFRDLFGAQTGVYFTFNGTGANVVALAPLLRPWEAVIAPETAHLNTDECGALERFAGSKILTVSTADGKLRVADLEPFARFGHGEHAVRPRVVSISQSTEYGGVYELDELRELCAFAHKNGWLVHMDGARIANAVAALGADAAEATKDAGVDVLTFGGTKNGLLFGEAVLFFDDRLHAGAALFVRKQGMQLASKMRFIAAQFEALLEDDLWLHNARHANAMGALLESRLRTIPGVRVTRPVRCNAVFAYIPPEQVKRAQERYFFYAFNEAEVRLMTTYETTQSDIEGLITALM